jgi:hypothetical protein
VSGLIHLKTNYEVFNTTDFTLDVGSGTSVKKIFLNGAEMDVVVQGNFDVSERELNNAFSHTGWWYDYFSGDSILVENAGLSVSLDPGEYHVYTSRRLGTPPNGFPTAAVELVRDYFQLELAPNPSSGPLQVDYTLPDGGPVRLDISDSQGRLIRTLFQGRQAGGEHRKTFDLELPAGIYYVHLQAIQKKEVKALVID